MIQEIQIKNFSIIESAQIQFQSGLHALSGETGAGKSFLLQAISFALGSRFDSDCIRSGAQEAVVTLVLGDVLSNPTQKLCQELGIDGADAEGSLYLRRILNKNGRSRAFINDQGVTLKALQSLGRVLVHQVGQHATRELTEELFLFKLLDHFGKHESLLQEFQNNLKLFQENFSKLQGLKKRVEEAQEQEDFMKFQFEELKQAHLKEGEEEELERQKQRVKNRVALATQTFEIAEGLVEGEDSVSDRLGRLFSLSEKTGALDECLKPVVTSIEKALEKIQWAGQKVREYHQDLEGEPASFDNLESRLALIHELKRKYRLDVTGLLVKEKELSQRLEELENFDQAMEELQAKVKVSKGKLKKSADRLHSSRVKTSQELTKLLKKNLKDLALPHTKLEWDLNPLDSMEQFSSQGGDSLTLLVSFNPGEEMRPFQEVISGGELSRLLLAIYEVLFPKDSFNTLIFDEVDTGVGGGVAELMGRKLKKLSEKSQVLCITHLPQIACQASWHYSVEKQVLKGRTFSQIRLLQGEERVQEIARMLAGVEVTPQALKHAQELLKNNAA